jgi:hypothetical protein
MTACVALSHKSLQNSPFENLLGKTTQGYTATQ